MARRRRVLTEFDRSFSHAVDVQPTIHMDDASGTEREIAADQRDSGPSDVLRLAPTPHRRDTIGDEPIVGVPDPCSHIGANDPRANLEDADAGLGEPHGKQLRHH